MKKVTALFLAFALVLGLAACGSTNSTSSVSSSDVQSWVNGLGL